MIACVRASENLCVNARLCMCLDAIVYDCAKYVCAGKRKCACVIGVCVLTKCAETATIITSAIRTTTD